jgi:serine/threonine protein kinase
MDPAVAPGTPPASNFHDGLGERRRISDAGGDIETLCLRRELTAIPSFEFALRERASRLANFRHTYYGRVRTIDRLNDPSATLAVVSDYTRGIRMSQLLTSADGRPVTIDINAALHLIRQLVSAVALLHENARDVAHGALGPERIVVTPNARLVIHEYVLGAALEQLRFSPERYWKELRVALPPSPGLPRFDHRVDVTQVGVVALSLVLGRLLTQDEYPAQVGDVLASAWAISARGGPEPLPHGLRGWLARALQLDPRHSFATLADARADLDKVLSGEDEAAYAADLMASTPAAEPPATPASVTPPSQPHRPTAAPRAAAPPPAANRVEPVVTTSAPAGKTSSALEDLLRSPADRLRQGSSSQEAGHHTDKAGLDAHKPAPPAEKSAHLTEKSGHQPQTTGYHEEKPGYRVEKPAAARPPLHDETPLVKPKPPVHDVKPAASRNSAGWEANLEKPAAPLNSAGWESTLEKPAASRKPEAPEPGPEKPAASRNSAGWESNLSGVEKPDAHDDDSASARVAAAREEKPAVAAKSSEYKPVLAAKSAEWEDRLASLTRPQVHDEKPAAAPKSPHSDEKPIVPAKAAPREERPTYQDRFTTSVSPNSSLFASAGHDADDHRLVAEQLAHNFDPPKRSGAKKMIAATVVLLALAGASVYFLRHQAAEVSAPTTGVLNITTNPTGAQVFVDGQARGVTPLTLDLNPGPHAVEVRGSGEPRSVPVTITAGAQTSQYIELPTSAPSATGQLQVRTEPSGAQVAVDGIVRGKSPVLVDTLTPGEHAVVVESDLGTVKQSVTVQPATTASLVVPLTGAGGAPLSGWIAIAAPVDLQVYENKRLIGSTQSGKITITAGRHELEIVNEALAYHATTVVQVAPNKVAPVKLEWPKGTIAVNALPWAEVWIDGEKVGETPIGNLSVPIGPHEILFRNPDLGEQRQAVTVSLQAPVRVSADLRKKP